ncbi:hypothetical protein WR25_02042 [Diploscapter pachys]|uniref:CHK kinase-like domain-containing protein n=1 Tax=Diploscapter pachys TaxID=2018661 RepID=A0A2A2KA12_9BILA|nr:hypothetical protein WR25_02042 [Diploscapter pachys]
MSLTEEGEGLFGTGVTLETVERQLRRALRTSKSCGQQKSVQRIGESQGFLSRVGVLDCRWPEGCQLPNKIVIKVCTLLNTIALHKRGGNAAKKVANGDAMKKEKSTWIAKSEKLRKWHNNEVHFYETCRRLKTVFDFIPKLYCATGFDIENEGNGFICMEYVDEAVCTAVHDNLSKEQVTETVEKIAQLQAEMLSSGPADLPNLLRVSAYEEMFGDMLQPEVLAFRLDEIRKMGPNVAKAIDRIEKQIDQLANVKIVRRCAEKNNMTQIFVHGDLYSPNLMWEKGEDGKLKLKKIIDWQLCHFGCASEDLCRLIVTSMEKEERRNSWRDILKQYHSTLHSLVDKQLFTYEQLCSSFCQLFAVSSLAFIASVHEMIASSTVSCSSEQTAARTAAIMDKVTGLLEDIPQFAHLD